MASFFILYGNRVVKDSQVFFHRLTDTCLVLIRRGASKHYNTKLWNRPVHIMKTFDTGKRLACSPNRVRVAMPEEDCVFN